MSTFLEQLFCLKGKTVVITGAAGFLGQSFVRGFLSAQARVIMLSRSEAVHPQQRQYAEQFGDGSAVGYQVDFYDRPSLDATLGDLLDRYKVDALVNNAYDFSVATGFNSPDGRLEASSFEQWQHAFQSGIYWAVRTTQVLGEQMRQRGGGSIVNVSSMYGIVSPNPQLYAGTRFFNPPSYGVAKAGLLAFTRYVAAFWGSDNVRCNALVPGAFSNTETESYNAVGKDDPFLKLLAARTLLNRVGRREELLGALLFLVSDASSYITGQALVVDGGWTVT